MIDGGERAAMPLENPHRPAGTPRENKAGAYGAIGAKTGAGVVPAETVLPNTAGRAKCEHINGSFG